MLNVSKLGKCKWYVCHLRIMWLYTTGKGAGIYLQTWWNLQKIKLNKYTTHRDFLSAQWLRLCFQCGGHRFNHWLGSWIPHALGWGQKERLKIYIYMVITEVYLQHGQSPRYVKLTNMLCTDTCVCVRVCVHVNICTCNYEQKTCIQTLWEGT